MMLNNVIHRQHLPTWHSSDSADMLQKQTNCSISKSDFPRFSQKKTRLKPKGKARNGQKRLSFFSCSRTDWHHHDKSWHKLMFWLRKMQCLLIRWQDVGISWIYVRVYWTTGIVCSIALGPSIPYHTHNNYLIDQTWSFPSSKRLSLSTHTHKHKHTALRKRSGK